MPDVQVAIHPLAPAHLERVRAFFVRIDTQEIRDQFAPHPFTDAEASRVCNHQGRDLYVGVFLENGQGRMVGYGMLRGLDAGYEVPSLGLCVVPGFQGKGIGRLLLDYLLRTCAERKAQRVMLKVKKDNPEARALYESVGFRFVEYDTAFRVGHLDLA